jgi:hypothetical protein
MGSMPVSLITRLRLGGRPAVVFAAAVMVLQAFFAGLVGAQAALVPTGSAGDVPVICHGHGGAPSGGGTSPDTPEQQQHPCCAFCTAGAGPAVLPTPALALFAGVCRPSKLPGLRAVSILIAPRAVRAGSSQAPPASV